MLPNPATVLSMGDWKNFNRLLFRELASSNNEIVVVVPLKAEGAPGRPKLWQATRPKRRTPEQLATLRESTIHVDAQQLNLCDSVLVRQTKAGGVGSE